MGTPPDFSIDAVSYRNFLRRSEISQQRVSIDTDFYINKSWSLGAGYRWYDYDSKGVSTSNAQSPYISEYSTSDSIININTTYWWQISDLFATHFSVAKQFNDDGDSPDSVLIGIEATARF